jgi:hypothetical protein
MTNITATVVIMIVTNWSNPVIPPAQFEQVQKLQGVPVERYRMGQVEEVTVAKVPSKQGEVQVVLDKVLKGYVEQLGTATETIIWKQENFIKKPEPTQTSTNKPVVLNALVNPPKAIPEPKKGFFGRLFSK